MEEMFKKINAAINIDQERQDYTKVYDFVRTTFIKDLKEFDVFKELFCDIILSGSYADNLKISAPDEFDLDIRLEFPFHSDVIIEEDPVNSGNIHINLKDVIKKTEAQKPPKEYMVKFLKSVVDDEGYLLQNKFQSWFESCVTKFLIKNQGNLIFNNEKIFVSYSKQGPAHTLHIRKQDKKFSIDFVPVIIFPCHKSICRKCPADGCWVAVPKPINGKQFNKSFRCSFDEAERKLLKGKYNFKNTLRMMKKFRDTKPHMKNLKSYYIKTLFLWSNEEKEDSFWRSPNLTIMEEMFERLERALELKTLPFYWDPRLNLLSAVSDGQITNMYREVKRARKILLCHDNVEDILNIFLTKTEEVGELIEQSEKCFASVAADVLTGFVKQHPLLMCGALTVFGGLFLWDSIRNSSRIRLMA